MPFMLTPMAKQRGKFDFLHGATLHEKILASIMLTLVYTFRYSLLMTQKEKREAEAWHKATLELIRVTGCQTYEQWKAEKQA